MCSDRGNIHNDIHNNKFSLTFDIPQILLPNLKISLRSDLFQIRFVNTLDNVSHILPKYDVLVIRKESVGYRYQQSNSVEILSHIQCIDLDMGPFPTHYSDLQANIIRKSKPSLTFSIV